MTKNREGNVEAIASGSERRQQDNDVTGSAAPNEEHWIRFKGNSYRVSTLALLVMLAAILLPSAEYSLGLKNPSPAELLVAISIGLFSAVVFLWILDATSVLRFRSTWVSRSVYGAAIVSVLGTSVGVYKDYFSPIRSPYEGTWEIVVRKPDSSTVVSQHTAILTFSDRSDSYWGYSNYVSHAEGREFVALGVDEFDPQGLRIRISLFRSTGEREMLETRMTMSKKGKSFVSQTTDKVNIEMSRPR